MQEYKRERRLLERSDISLKTKVNVYKAVVIPVFLYVRDSWTIFSLYKLIKIRWQDKISDADIFSWSDMSSIDTQQDEAHAKWIG